MDDSAADYRPCSDVISTQLDEEESVLLSLETQHYYSINETGSRIWELLSDGKNASEIAHAITEEWDIEYEEALRYVHSFLDELHDEGLVEHVSDSD